jgi:hypothetical protein
MSHARQHQSKGKKGRNQAETKATRQKPKLNGNALA